MTHTLTRRSFVAAAAAAVRLKHNMQKRAKGRLDFMSCPRRCGFKVVILPGWAGETS